MSANNKKESKKPEDSDFQQQRLKAWQPLLTPVWVISTFAFIGLLFVIIGLVIYDASSKVVEVEQRYDLDTPNCNWTTGVNCTTTVQLKIPDDMKPPIFFYYKLRNFYQNHRRYVKSRSDPQLKSTSPVSAADLQSCDPLTKFSSPDDPSKKLDLYPCGLIANSFFNDTFETPELNGFPVEWNRTGIAWQSDIDVKFSWRPSVNSTETDIGPSGHQVWTKDNNEDFIVWMRTAGLPTFKKLNKRILNTEFKKDDYFNVTVTSVFPVASFKGEKWVVLSTTSWLGGKNDFLGIAYIVVGGVCILLAIVFWIKHKISPRKLGEMQYFNMPCAPKH